MATDGADHLQSNRERAERKEPRESGNRTSHADRIGEPGAVVRRGRDGAPEMVNLIWGLEPAAPGGRPFEAVRAEACTFRRNRCLVPASEFFHVRKGCRHRFTRVDGDWFYLAGIWRPSSASWPSAYAVLTVEANEDVRPFADRQMVVVPRDERMNWLDATSPENVLLRALPTGTFKSERWDGDKPPQQTELAL